MFRRTERQLPLLGAEQGLPGGARQRLSSSWAEGFRGKVMVELLLVEEQFAGLYAAEGRPNWSVACLLGLCLLQHQSGLSDQEALDALSFDVRWQYALGLAPEDAYLSRRSLVEFRRRLVQHDPEGELVRRVFDRVLAAGVEQLGISVSEQRLDSTLVMSNIRTMGRSALARETLRHFIRHLSDASRSRLPSDVLQWFASEGGTWEGDGNAQQAKQRLHQMGRWIAQLLALFADTKEVAESEPFLLMRRMLEEHAETLVLSDPPAGSEPSDDGDDPSAEDDEPPSMDPAPPGADELGPKDKATRKQRASKTNKPRAHYWSVHDPDASFGHKGCGYHVHFTETCRNTSTELLTDYCVLTAASSDVGQASPTLDRLEQRGLKPSIMYADAGYPTPNELVRLPERGIELCAPVHRGQLKKDTFSRTEFEMDPDTGLALRCPQGHAPTRHAERESSDTMHPRRAVHAFFDQCGTCEHRKRCPVRQPNNAKSREYRLDLAPELMARDRRWTEQHTEEFRTRYRIRAGVEATMSELKRAHRLGRLRVRRIAQVRLQVALKATACNIKRWLRALLALVGELGSVYGLILAHLLAQAALPSAPRQVA